MNILVRLLFLTVFILIITPLATFARFAGYDALNLNPGTPQDTYWNKRDKTINFKEQ